MSTVRVTITPVEHLRAIKQVPRPTNISTVFKLADIPVLSTNKWTAHFRDTYRGKQDNIVRGTAPLYCLSWRCFRWSTVLFLSPSRCVSDRSYTVRHFCVHHETMWQRILNESCMHLCSSSTPLFLWIPSKIIFNKLVRGCLLHCSRDYHQKNIKYKGQSSDFPLFWAEVLNNKSDRLIICRTGSGRIGYTSYGIAGLFCT